MKKRLVIRSEANLRDGLDHRVLQTGHQLTAIVEQYIKDGQARDAGQLVEIQSLPEIRAVVRGETSRASDSSISSLVPTWRRARRRVMIRESQ
jgi:hypothetical protein